MGKRPANRNRALRSRPYDGISHLVIAHERRWQFRRDGKVSLREQVAGRELLGISFSPVLGHGRGAKFEGPLLRLICRGGRVVRVWPPALGRHGRHLRDLLIAATLRLRRVHPELGLPTEPQRPGRCHRCATSYLVAPGVLCPSCSTFPGEIR